MKYKCLILDHDDTVVNSTTQIHYPAFLEALSVMRPNYTLSLEEYFIYNFTPGFVNFCTNDLGFNDKDFKQETDIWLNYVKDHIPTVYDGMKEIIDEQKRQGGLVCVISHSMSSNIYRDYEKNRLPKPDMVFGWDLPPEQRKPHPYPIQQIMQHYSLEPSDLLMVDDLKPGYDMAKSCGIDFAAAGWSHNIKQIKDFMQSNCDYYFDSTADLKYFLFDN